MKPLPSQELLAVVDENDNVIGTCARHIVHASGMMHRAVHILVFDDSGRLFLQKRSMLKDLNPGLWDTSAAGHVDADEDYDGSAVRELREELGVEHEGPLARVFKIPPTAENGMEFVQVYLVTHNGPFELAADEIDEGGWFGPDEIDARVKADDTNLTPTFKMLWRQRGAESGL
ncbi:NUDIX hydrolase [Candidatus Methylomicrobium oryzae]|uniref:NUDIX hydrolase n=1 Tax=Candidatus Methylomicrobium oryzae TaxID=2802053 RepID=UPI0019208D71|nr:NUDIX domain-containing protein [Methylomicrobium sp. RS1]MBL1262397.1 NUDIX domain-containing protein [Methylomicrobium sp. RS1]